MKLTIAGRYFDGRYWKVKAPGHPSVAHMKPKYQYVAEHRLIMEDILGRYLEDDEHVYHKNGDKTDNKPENLEVIRSISEHNEKYRWHKTK